MLVLGRDSLQSPVPLQNTVYFAFTGETLDHCLIFDASLSPLTVSDSDPGDIASTQCSRVKSNLLHMPRRNLRLPLRALELGARSCISISIHNFHRYVEG